MQLPEDVSPERYELNVDLTHGKVALTEKLQTSSPVTAMSHGVKGYFIMSGVRLANEPDQGLYMVLQNGTVTKKLKP